MYIINDKSYEWNFVSFWFERSKIYVEAYLTHKTKTKYETFRYIMDQIYFNSFLICRYIDI